MPLITTAEQKVSTMALSSIHGMNASRQGGKVFSEMFLSPDYPPLQNGEKAEALLSAVLARHSRGWRLAQERWSDRIWVNNSDGAHRLSAVAEANMRLNLGLSLCNVHMTIYDYNRKIVSMTPNCFRFILPSITADTLEEIPSATMFMNIHDIHGDRSPRGLGHGKPVINKLVTGESGSVFEYALRKKLDAAGCRYLEIR